MCSRYPLSVFTKDVTSEMCIPCSLSVFTTDVTTETCIPYLLSVFTIDVTTDMYIPCSRFANQNFNSRITLMFGYADKFFVQLVEYLCSLSISDSCFYLHILLMYC